MGEPEVGTVLGDRYELVSWISKTNMSSVFKAWDCHQKCFVAIKIATNIPGSSNLVRCLERESYALRSLDHPRVVRLLDTGYVGASYYKSYFVVLEYLHGINLAACLNNNISVPFLEIGMEIALGMLEGVEAIHQAGLVHRDLKLENLMITPTGVKIIDFGIVKFASEINTDPKPSGQPRKIFGTFPYLSPEQAQDLHDLDHRSDLFACGVILYEILTGVSPFTCDEFVKNGKTVEYWKLPLRMFSEAAPSVRVPSKVQAVVWKALAADRSLRYQTAAEMRMELLAAVPSLFERFLKEYEEKFGELVLPLRKTIPVPKP